MPYVLIVDDEASIRDFLRLRPRGYADRHTQPERRAVDYVTKPFGREPLQQALRRAEERLQQ